jgi:putative Holliday junction resolvase
VSVRVLGVDVGERRIGLAVSDPSGTISTPYGMVARGPRAAGEIAATAAAVAATAIVVGLPLSLRGGREGPQAAAVRAFAAEIAAATDLPLEFYDERLTTVMAERALTAQRVRGEKRKAQVDAAAAAIMLQGWLDRRRAQARAAEGW